MLIRSMSKRKYLTNRMETHVLYSELLNFKSLDSELSFPLIIALQSRKLKKYVSHKIGCILLANLFQRSD